MVASIVASAFLPAPASSTASMKALRAIGEGHQSLNARGIAARTASSSGSMQVRANAQAVPKLNGTKVDLKSETLKTEEDASSSAPGTSYNQLPDWSMLLAAITTIFFAAEKQWTLLDWKPKRPDMLADSFGIAKIVQDGLTFRQNFSIRSYEIEADLTASMETLMNLLQETSLNHAKVIGVMDNTFGVTPEMSKRNLIFVMAKMHVLVDKYPSWRDVVQIDTWIKSSKKNGLRRDWHVINCQTGETILRATSVLVMMHKHTRKLSKMPDEVKAEIGPHFIGRNAVIEEDCGKVPKLDDSTAHYVQNGLTPRWGDLDANKHVNNVKYIGWILESVPASILESHEVAVMTLEYRRECGRESVLQSLTSVTTDYAVESLGTGMECVHLLQNENGDAIMKGNTKWRPKRRPQVSTPFPLA